MSQSSLLSLGRYLVVAVAIALLAPYAGCHILTSPPDPVSTGGDANSRRGGSSGLRETLRDPSLQPAPDHTAPTRSDEAAEARESGFSEIEGLLQDP